MAVRSTRRSAFLILVLAFIELNRTHSLLAPLKSQQHYPCRVSRVSRTALELSPFDSVFKNAFTPRKQSGVESSIEAAIILTDKKRQDEWKKDIGQKYPLIPPFMVDICTDLLSGAFESIAPSELQAVLRPGGLEKARPKMEREIVTTLEQQQLLQGIPLKQEDKRQFIQYVVNMGLDYFLRDAELALAKPSAKLEALDAQKREIQRYMTPRQLLLYRIQNYPLQMTLIGTTCIYVICTLYEATKHTWLMSNTIQTLVYVASNIGLMCKKVLKVLGLRPNRALQKKSFRLAVRR
jgi:hypothetical protein